jgi:hypothetical protein
VQRVLAHPTKPTTHLYAASWDGVYESTDGCASFRRFGRALPNVQVKDMHIIEPLDGSPPLLRAATYGRSVWEILLN